jgi:hypothetical protein
VLETSFKVAMLIVALAFMFIFLFRDVLILATRDRAILARFTGYAILLVTAVTLMAGSGDARPGILYSWTQPRFALIAVLVQLAELAVGVSLRRFAMGRYSWIGCVLPAPAFLVVLFAFSFEVQDRFITVDPMGALALVTAVWLALVGGLVIASNWLNNPWEDRKFANDFALMTGCTALIFVPFGFF